MPIMYVTVKGVVNDAFRETFSVEDRNTVESTMLVDTISDEKTALFVEFVVINSISFSLGQPL